MLIKQKFKFMVLPESHGEVMLWIKVQDFYFALLHIYRDFVCLYYILHQTEGKKLYTATSLAL
jgi:hypothetical protein